MRPRVGSSCTGTHLTHKKRLLAMKILVATEKPFAAVAVKGIREVVEAAGAELVLLEKLNRA